MDYEVNGDGELEYVSETGFYLSDIMETYDYGSSGLFMPFSSGTNIVKLYYHSNRLGSIDYITDNVSGNVMGYITYDDWGALTSKQVLRTNQRELDLVQQYTVHPYDQVLGVYFAQARMYDAADRRFMAVDLVKGWISEPASLVQYIYCVDNPLRFIDMFGLSGDNPYNLLGKPSNFNNVSRMNVDGKFYYHVGGVMSVLGGTAVYDKESNSSTLNLTYDAITANVVYCMNDVPRTDLWLFSIAIDNSIIHATGTYKEINSKGFTVTGSIFGKLPILYYAQKTYVNLSDLRDYFEHLWCKYGSPTGDYTPPEMILKPSPSRKPSPSPSPTPIPNQSPTQLLKSIPKALTWLGNAVSTYANESDLSVIARMLYGEDPKSMDGHLWVLENRRIAGNFIGGNTYRGLALGENQFTCMSGTKSRDPSSRFDRPGERTDWENCVDKAFTFVNNGISSIPKPKGKKGADFTYPWTHKYGGEYTENGRYQNGVKIGGTWFYHK